MADSASTDSPLDAAAGVAGPEATKAFELLANETRLAILLALWEAEDPFEANPTDYTESDAIPFSDLRKRVGMRDPGQFHYHLDKLVGRFVEKSEDGLKLREAGAQVVRTVIASTGFEPKSLPQTEIESPCPNCGGRTAITYTDHRLYQLCTDCSGTYTLDDRHPDGVLNGWRANPAVLSHQSAEAIYHASRTEAIHQYALRFAGVCPMCSGRLEQSLHVCEAHDPVEGRPCPTCHRQYEIAARFVCTVCKAANVCSAVKLALLKDIPAIAEFLGAHDIVPEFPYGSETPGLTTEGAVDSTDPLVIRLTLEVDDDQLHVIVDEELTVTNVIEGEPAH